MRFSSSFRPKLSPSSKRRKQRLAAARRRGARLESLEARNLLTTWTVNGAGGADFTTIGAAIAAASNNDTIQIAPGTYNENLVIGSSLTSLTIQGSGSGNTASDTIIDAGGAVGIEIDASGASAASRLTIEGLRVQDASNAVYFNSAVSHVTLDNVATVGSNNGIEIHNSAVISDLLLNNVQSTGNSNGFRVATSGSVNGLTIQGGAFDNNNIGFYVNANGASATNQNDFTNVSITGTSFSNDANKGIYVEKLDHATLDGILVNNSGSSDPFSAGVDINLKYGDYQSIAVQNSSITASGLGDAVAGVGLTVKARSDAPSYNSNPATLSGVLISHNIISGDQTALRIGEAGGLTSPTNVAVNYNDLSGSVSGVALDNEIGATVDASKNWWGDISGPMIASNVGGLGQSIAGPGAASVTFAPWLIYGTDADAVAPGFQLPATITVTAGGEVSAADNDFTRLQNAVGAVAAGQTLELSGTFDWTSPLAAAAYAASSSTSTGGDIRGVLLPSGVNNVTLTSAGGGATVKGGGDFNDAIYSSFLFAADGPSALGNDNLTIENLNLDHFESGVVLGWNATGQFNGTHVQNNTITVAGDNGWTQNIAVYFWHGVNQQMTGNTIDFEADGTNAGPSGPRSFGFQNGTTGGTGYDGLTIANNTFQLLNAAAHNETLTGIWENGHNDDNSSHIAITGNQFLGIQGAQDFDRGLMLTSQTSNLLVDGNTFTDVHYVFFARNASGGTDPGDQFTFTNNVLTRVGGADGVFLRNVTDDATPTHVLIHWNIDNTVDGETGARGLNELSVQASHASRPTSGASDLDSVDAVGARLVVFVNTAWNSAARFTDPDGIGAGAGPVAYGFNGFSTIQLGIDNVDPSGTVNVAAGTYVENVNVDKSVTLLGPNAGIDPNTGTRGAEAIVLPATDDAANGAIFLVTADNVTIDGLTIDGDNPSLSGGTALNGVDSNAANGVTNVGSATTTDVSGLTVQNNVIQNFTNNGIYGDTDSGAPSTGNTFSHNKIDNIPLTTLSPRGRGILIGDNFYAEIADNVMTRVAIGIQTNNFYAAGSPSLIDHNTIDYYVRGIYHNLTYSSASPFTISNNQITADAGAVAGNAGLLIFSMQNNASVVVQNNDVTGAQYGIELWSDPTSNTIVIQGGTLSGNAYGVWATNNDPLYGAADATQAALDGVTITGSTVAGVLVDDQPAGTNTIGLDIRNSSISGGPIGVEINGGRATASLFRNTISGSTTGVQVDAGGNLGTALQATSENSITGGDTGIFIASGAGAIEPIFGNNLSGNTTAALANNSGVLVDASGNWWGDSTEAGVMGAISGGDVDFTPWLNGGADTDAGTAGFQGDFSSVTVDGNSPQAGAAAPVQEGVDLATSGGTVNVVAGTYAENVSIDKDLTLAGQGGVTLSGSGSGSGTGVDITGSPGVVTLSGLDIQNYDTGVASSGGTTLNLTDVTLGGNAIVGASISSVGDLNVASTAGTDQNVTITAGSPNQLQFAGQDAIEFSDVNNLSVATGSGSDTFEVAPLSGTTVSLDGGDPTPPASPGDQLLVDLTGTTGAALSVTNSAAGTSGTWSFGGSDPINFSHIESLQSTADLDVTNSAPGSVVEGDTFTYTITIHNNSPADITNVVLTDVLPTGVSFVSGSFDQGTVVNNSGTLTVDIGTIAAGATINGTITVKAVEEGSLANTIDLTSDAPNPIPSVTANTNVSDPAVIATGGFTINAIKGTLTDPVVVATFTDPGGAEDLENYSADIDWGDGNTSSGVITFDSGTGVFTVTGQNTYATAGTFTITVTIHHLAAPDATATDTADVANPVVVAQGGLTINAVEGEDTGTVDVATFVDPGGAGPLSDYSADIDWGDGNTTAGTITYDAGSDTFTIHGNHAYGEDGTKLITVTIHRVAAPDTVVNSTAIVAEPAITATGVAVNGNEFSALTNVTVATFTHGNNTEAAGNFTVTIHWGDGTSSTGTVTLSGGVYTVAGSHTYTDEGTYDITVSIVDDSASATVHATATMLEELLPDGTRGTAQDRFISELYRELLHRKVDATGLAHWNSLLDHGASRRDVVEGIQSSTEYRAVEVTDLYEQYLHRAVDPLGLASWTQFLAHGGTLEQLASMIVSSSEYFQVRGGGTNQGFIDALYHDALERTPDPSGETSFEQFLASGKTRLQAAEVVFGSVEYRDLLVESFYHNFLGRAPDAGGLSYWADRLADHDVDEVIADIVSANEFSDRVAP